MLCQILDPTIEFYMHEIIDESFPAVNNEYIHLNSLVLSDPRPLCPQGGGHSSVGEHLLCMPKVPGSVLNISSSRL